MTYRKETKMSARRVRKTVRDAVLSIALAAGLAVSPMPAHAADPVAIMVVKGACGPESYIADGAIGDDLTERRSRFFCNMVDATVFSDTNNHHVMLSFVESKSNHAPQLAFGGWLEDNTLTVNRVYLDTNGKPTPALDGSRCLIALGKRGQVTEISCAASADEKGRRIEAVVAFVGSDDEPTGFHVLRRPR
jgi:hypothetical protein